MTIKLKRKEKNLTQKEVADKVGITRQMYSCVENGKRRPSVEVAKKIAEVLDIEWTKFFD